MGNRSTSRIQQVSIGSKPHPWMDEFEARLITEVEKRQDEFFAFTTDTTGGKTFAIVMNGISRSPTPSFDESVDFHFEFHQVLHRVTEIKHLWVMVKFEPMPSSSMQYRVVLVRGPSCCLDWCC